MGPVRQLDLTHRLGATRIWMGPGALEESKAQLVDWSEGRRLFVVTSEPVRALCGDWLAEALSPAAKTTGGPVFLEVADGEAGKDLATIERLTRAMVEAGGKRDSRLVTLGGGTVGDVGGFAAACFLRGIEYAHVPTTLLAQVDASIGGKTGVNLPEAKNSVGAFHQPRFVVADARVLKTLPADQIRQGLFEVVKAAILADESLFDLLEAELPRIMKAEPMPMGAAIQAAVAVKVSVVASDERESGARRLLNLGHTLGHALETALGHGKLGHGDAVGHGLLFAVELARERGLSAAAAARIRSLVERMDLPPLSELDPEIVVRALNRDKKARESGLRWVLPTRIGHAQVVDDLDPASVEDLLASFLAGSVQSA